MVHTVILHIIQISWVVLLSCLLLVMENEPPPLMLLIGMSMTTVVLFLSHEFSMLFVREIPDFN